MSDKDFLEDRRIIVLERMQCIRGDYDLHASVSVKARERADNAFRDWLRLFDELEAIDAKLKTEGKL